MRQNQMPLDSRSYRKLIKCLDNVLIAECSQYPNDLESPKLSTH